MLPTPVSHLFAEGFSTIRRIFLSFEEIDDEISLILCEKDDGARNTICPNPFW
jgi:hypothetical protein